MKSGKLIHLFYNCYFFIPCWILNRVERMASWVIPIVRRTALSSIPIS